MTSLEELTPGTLVHGIQTDNPVEVVSVTWHGQQAVELTYKVSDTGAVSNQLLFRSDETRLRIAEAGRTWAFDGDGAMFRLVAEAHRIRLAYLFDPRLAVHVSQVEPLPHQIAAVYGEMLKRQPLRYLLADDPGAGKTIMAGLFIKELILRGDLERCLVICPANLAEQWQDELAEKFKLSFEIVGSREIESSASRNPFQEKSLVIGRIDGLKRDEPLERLSQTEWDLVVVDEAHKMSASWHGGEADFTSRYRLGQMILDPARARHILLLTATPHNGKEEEFQLFLQLIDQDRFEGRFRDGVHKVDVSDIMRRMLKEEMVDFEGKPLFPERRAHTVTYVLSDSENELYTRVTEYVKEEMNRAERVAAEEGDRQRRNVVGFALTILQRRLASSPEAIYQSLRRRRERLETRLEEEQAMRLTAVVLALDPNLKAVVDYEDLDELPDEEAEDYEDQVVDRASAARDIAELEAEIQTLKSLEQLANQVRRSNTDRKLQELRGILDDRKEMFDSRGSRRKLIIFTEHKDTLYYLMEKIISHVGDPKMVVEIHGGLRRDERRQRQESFLQDPDVTILIATDAAGEGVNLQRAHLMVNYDLPWNPNRIEQRFGRIHRFGQRNVCHLWNLVAHETREGHVFERLLRKLETESQALGGKVFDVLGSVFEGASLRELLLEAIRYGDDPATRARLEQSIDDLMSRERYQHLFEENALAVESMDTTRLQSIREDMDRAEALRLQPHFIASFFLEGFRLLGGTVKERESRRYEVRRVPQEVIRRARELGPGLPLSQRYERIVFEKDMVNVDGRPQAEFVAPGHPLMDATMDLVLERHRHLMRRGAVLVDDREDGPDHPRVMFFVEHSVRDGKEGRHGNPRIMSKRMHFVEVAEDGAVAGGGSAPYLDYRPLNSDEFPASGRILKSTWLNQDLESTARSFAIQNLVPGHFEDVQSYRQDLITKTMAAVKDRLTREIAYWDNRAVELKEQELAGRKPRLNSGQARRRADDLASRLESRMKELEQERQLAPLPPVVTAGTLVIPARMLSAGERASSPTPSHEARKVIEELAMKAVEDTERREGRIPTPVPHLNLGYDIESRDPVSGRLHFIEVKGRHADADSVYITRNEWLVALNKREMYTLAIVLVRDGDVVDGPHYIQDPMRRALSGDLTFGITGVDLSISELAEL